MQRLSITASLNGTTLQFDEAAFARLEQYLADARRTLADNPDQAEILADLEQAVADQCKRRLPPERLVVTPAELEPALEEIGTVQVPDGAAAPQPEPPPRSSRHPFEQVSEGALISGVCLGLARYLDVDVTLVRIVALLLLFFTGGAMIFVYLILMLLLPYAPPKPGAPPIGKLPAKSREFVEFVRGKLSTAAG
jgi:phage shock protein PspC (stress-responsive transcriptional regulator)